MTERQTRCLDFIRARIGSTGVAPSYPEIAKALELNSRSTVYALVQSLIRDGALEKTGGGSRNLRLPGATLTAVPTEALLTELIRRKVIADA